MDDAEISVLKRAKEGFMKKKDDLNMPDDMFQDLIKANILTENLVKTIVQEKRPELRMTKLIDIVMETKVPGAFAQLAAAIELNNKWAARHMILDLQVERGQLATSMEIAMEAKAIINKLYGRPMSAKHFKPPEMLEMADVLGQKMYQTFNEAENMVKDADAELVQLGTRNKEVDAQAVEIANNLLKFVQKEMEHLKTYSKDPASLQRILAKLKTAAVQTDADVILPAIKDILMPDLLPRLREALERFDVPYKERQRCLQILDESPTSSKPLDELISDLTRKAINPNMEAEDHRVARRRLDRNIMELEERLEAYERRIEMARANLGDDTRDCAYARQEMTSMKEMSPKQRRESMQKRQSQTLHNDGDRRKSTLPNIDIGSFQQPSLAKR